jgi:hypothetical protein
LILVGLLLVGSGVYVVMYASNRKPTHQNWKWMLELEYW